MPKETAQAAENAPVKAAPAVVIDEQGRAFLKGVTPRDILRAINDAPPLQRDHIAATSYVGRWVDWTGEIYGLVEHERTVYVHLRTDGSRFPMIEAKFPASGKTALLDLREGDTISLRAKIDSVDVFRGVTLTQATLTQAPVRTSR